MAFASVYIPNFMLQSVVRAEPDLSDRAVALVDGSPRLWIVVAVNEAALQAGIEVGTGGPQATHFGQVEIRRRSLSQEKSAHAALRDVAWSISPCVEDTAPDTLALDLAGLSALFSSLEDIAKALAERTSSIGLRPRIAVASNIDVAIHAARGFAGITLIPQGEESIRLSALPIEVLSPTAEILEILHRWGIRTCGALAALPVLRLSERQGQEGVRLHALACGTSSRSLVLAQSEIDFTEEMELDSAITELEPLAFFLCRLLDQLCARLATRSLAASAFCLRFDLQDCVQEAEGEVEIVRKRSPLASDATTGPKTYEKVLRLPVPMRDSKTLLKLLRLQLQSDPPHGSIIKIVLTAEPARPRTGQKGLFVPDSPDAEKLEVTIARLAGLVGNSNVGSPRLVDTHRPGEFRMAPFFPSLEKASVPRKGGATKPKPNEKGIHQSKPRRAVIGFRIFRPEPQADVESREGCPCRISFRGLRGDVVAASGPWRTSGDWWNEHGWRQDEWDVEIRIQSSGNKPGNRQGSPAAGQNGLYRIYYDWMRKDWFVRGRYD